MLSEWEHVKAVLCRLHAPVCVSIQYIPVLLRAECGAAAAIAVDLLHSGADIIVAHMQHVEAGR